MIYKVGDVIKTKKPHACGERKWEIIRVGADVKLKCLKCGRTVFLSVPETERVTAVYYPAGENVNGD